MMNIKWLMTASAFVLITASVAKAADVMVPIDPTPAAPVVVAPTFSWTGFYLGGQIGSFSSKTRMNAVRKDVVPLVPPAFPAFSTNEEFLPKLSGFIGGIYVGSNIELGNGVIFGVDTDMVWSGKSDSKAGRSYPLAEGQAADLEEVLKEAGIQVADGQIKDGDAYVSSLTFKEKWSGATRVRLGFAADRIMPYIAGGVAYARIQDVISVSVQAKDNGPAIVSGDLSDETKTLLGYALGAGVDFAMTDNVILRAEYRYSDFGKKKFTNNERELSYKTNDFRVGVAYKF